VARHRPLFPIERMCRVHPRQVGQDGGHFFAAEYDGQPGRTLGADETVEPRHIYGQDALVEEE